MNCEQIKELWKLPQYDSLSFMFCPNCGIHAPWINDCKEEEK